MSAATQQPSPEARAEGCAAAADLLDGLVRRAREAFCLAGIAGAGTDNGTAVWYRSLVDADTLMLAAIDDLRARANPPVEPPVASVLPMRRAPRGAR